VKRGDSTIDNLLKRERLLARCAAQRDELAALMRQLDGPLRIADKGIAGVHYLRDHPVALGGVAALLAVVQRRNLWKWARRGFVAWRAYRAFRTSNFKSGF
jgi:hypothetical protein